MLLTIDYAYLKKWKPIVLTTFFVILLYQAIVYLHPANTEWIGSEQFSLLNTLQFVFIDQILIECITVAILFQIIRIYATRLRLFELQLSMGEILKYQVKFLPVLLVAFFFFAPFTLTTRFVYHYFPVLSWADYFEMYFYSIELYLTYLTPVLFVGYVIINVNLIRQYNEQLSKTGAQLSKEKQRMTRTRLWASDDFGELFLDTEKIKWIERKDRKTLAAANDETYRLKETITQLEEKLNPDHFVRVNRSVIVQLSEVLNYSFWENEKYILRLKSDEKEFVIIDQQTEEQNDQKRTDVTEFPNRVRLG